MDNVVNKVFCVAIFSMMLFFIPQHILNAQVGSEPTVFVPADDFRPRIIIINLYKNAVDLQVGEVPIFSVKNLKPYTPTAVTALDYCTHPVLYYKSSTNYQWKIFVDGNGKPHELKFMPWSTQIIRIGNSGEITIIPLLRVGNGTAHCAFINALGQKLEEISLVNSDFISTLQVQNIPDQAFTSFADIVPGTYGAVWRGRNYNAYTIGNRNGPLGLVSIKNDAWYLVIASPGNDSRDAIQIWDLGDVQPFVISD